jgi:hypothetical protein
VSLEVGLAGGDGGPSAVERGEQRGRLPLADTAAHHLAREGLNRADDPHTAELQLGARQLAVWLSTEIIIEMTPL